MPAHGVYEELQRDAVARQLSEAERVLASLRHFNATARRRGVEVGVLEAWSDSASSVCVIYRAASGSQRFGLRRQFPSHFYGTPESTGDGMQMDMEEPRGAARSSVDDEGVIWHGHLVNPLPTAP
jgi:hypothetical protein